MMDNEAIAFPLFSLLGLLALRALHCPRKAGMQLLHMNQVSLLLQAAFKALGHCAPEELASGEMSKVFKKSCHLQTFHGFHRGLPGWLHPLSSSLDALFLHCLCI
jgi:hypothetical protein